MNMPDTPWMLAFYALLIFVMGFGLGALSMTKTRAYIMKTAEMVNEKLTEMERRLGL